ncbi:hypothetical protein EVA_04075 [gut metagenome]|uniref:Uncharacterized protein n=1 Tax=gut metagenome TaxID=749906 RepID=J9D524_9ZZZZ
MVSFSWSSGRYPVPIKRRCRSMSSECPVLPVWINFWVMTRNPLVFNLLAYQAVQ